MRPLAQPLKAVCCLSSKFSVSINIPGLTQQLSVSKLKFCLLAVTEVWAHVTLTPVSPGTFTADLAGHIFLSGKLKNQLWADGKNLNLLKDGIYQPDSSLLAPSATKMLLPEPTREKKKPLRWWRRRTFPLGNTPKTGLFLYYSSLTFPRGRAIFSAPHRNNGLWLSLGETEVQHRKSPQIMKNVKRMDGKVVSLEQKNHIFFRYILKNNSIDTHSF